MKTRLQRNQLVRIPASRWAGYAVAGVATGLMGGASADGEIHYSGRIDLKFRPDENKTVGFQLDQPGASILFGHYTFFAAPYAFFEVQGLQSEAFVGYSIFEYAFAYRLRRARNHYISEGSFVNFYDRGILYDERGGGRWGGKVSGFVGFRFDNGAGPQYGWARVRMGGLDADFILLDYAYGDPGEPVRPGQTSSSKKTDVAEEGSLGLLALGAADLTVWRKRRRLAT